MLNHNMLRCQWCGAEGSPEDFELDDKHHRGFWCPDCDGFTFYDEEANDRRRMLLLLESKGAEQPAFKRGPQFHKRLSPLRYPGGKSKLIDFLFQYFHEEQLDSFVEVFAGGASVGLALLDAGITKRLVLNDLDIGVYSLWKTITERPGALQERLLGSSPTADTFYACRAVLDAPDGHSQEDLAWAELICNRLSFSGISKANALGGKNGSQKALLSRWNPEGLIKRISRIHEMRSQIAVTRMDASRLIEEYAYWDERATLFVDPPYVQKGEQLYRCFFTEEDHQNLAFLLESLYQGMPGADIVITYDDCPLIREIYSYAEVVPISRTYSI